MSTIRFAFIGGTKRGFRLIENLLDKKLLPEFAIVLKEDEHESEKYSESIMNILNKRKIQNTLKKKLTDADYQMLKESNLDLIIVYGWRTLIDPDLNNYLKTGIVAAHHSLLPKYRGFAPIQWAIINGETETGVTLFKISEGEIDSGKIISQKKFEIEFKDDGSSLEDKATSVSIDLFTELFDNHKKNTITIYDQDEKNATYACKRIPEDGKIDWYQSSLQIYNQIRALTYPNPEAFCFLKNDCYSILKSRLGESNNKKFTGKIPGRIYKIFKDGIEVICGEGTIHLEKWKNKSDGTVTVPSEIVKFIGSTLK